jgi:flagellar biosynthetic protein FlhB
MAEHYDKDSRTEEATEKKIRDSLEKGRVPYSREAATFASILGILIAAFFLVGDKALRVRFSLESFIDDPGGFNLENGSDAAALMQAVAADAALLVLPVVAVIAIAGIASSLLQNQPQLVLERIKPDTSRISLSKGWTRIFGLQGQVEFLKALFKLAFVSVAGYASLATAHQDFVNALFMEPGSVPGLMQDLAIRFLSAVAVATAALVGADLAWSRISWRRDLRMSRQEVKDELKQTEGDPLIKMRLRSLQRERSRKRMMAAVPRATLVIANPTHYSVALRYVREEGGAPVVLAKGKDLIALKIRFIAEAHGIPVYEDRALARSLYESVEVERMIPPEFYKAVAGIILFLAARGKQAKPATRN